MKFDNSDSNKMDPLSAKFFCIDEVLTVISKKNQHQTSGILKIFAYI